MRYLLIEEKAWEELQAWGRKATDAVQRLKRHFNPAGETG